MRFPIMGFDESHKMRFTSALVAMDVAGGFAKVRTSVRKHPVLIGEHMVCVRIGDDFGTVFTAKEAENIVSVVKRTPSMTKDGNRLAQWIKSCAEGVRDKELSRSRMM